MHVPLEKFSLKRNTLKIWTLNRNKLVLQGHSYYIWGSGLNSQEHPNTLYSLFPFQSSTIGWVSATLITKLNSVLLWKWERSTLSNIVFFFFWKTSVWRCIYLLYMIAGVCDWNAGVDIKRATRAGSRPLPHRPWDWTSCLCRLFQIQTHLKFSVFKDEM